MPTIAAIATPPGKGGIGIIRLSGPGAKALLARVFLPKSPRFTNFRPWTMHRGALLDARDVPLDDVLAVFMPGPRTYSGEDMAEIHCHGGRAIIAAALESFLRLGARLADPGEFTKRAYLNGRMDLAQAEAVAELIAAPSRDVIRDGFGRLEGRLTEVVENLSGELNELRALARVGVDFPDDEVDGPDRAEMLARVEKMASFIASLLKSSGRASLMANGAMVVLAGAVNAGKSSIFNALSGKERALVTEIPGTTRDYIEMPLLLDGLPIILRDTAGLRETSDQVEKMGIASTFKAIDEADLVCLVLDGAKADTVPRQARELSESLQGKTCIGVWNKTDLAPMPEGLSSLPGLARVMGVSARTGENMDELADAIRELLLRDTGEEDSVCAPPPNMRQGQALKEALQELQALYADLQADVPFDCCLERIDEASALLGKVVTLAPEDELLDKIFSQFCIGK